MTDQVTATEPPKIINLVVLPITEIKRPNIAVVEIAPGLHWYVYIDSKDLDYIGIGDMITVKIEVPRREKRLVTSES